MMVGIDFVKDSRTVIVRINEEIDHHTCEKIKNKIDLAIEFRKAKFLIFDFGGVSFMDSSGIGLIMGRFRTISKSGGQVILVNLKPAVAKILKMAGIFKIVSEAKNIDCVLQKISAEV